MTDIENTSTVSKGAKIAGWVISILPALLLFMSASFKFMPVTKEFSDGLEHMGWTSDVMFKIGFVEVACTLLYLFPRTSVFGAILLTGYMGGAIATHVRVGDPFWTQILVGVFVWLGLWLREPRLKALIPIRS